MEFYILSYTETTTTMKREIPSDFVPYPIKREADETHHDFINTCLDNGNQFVAISKKHNEQWDTLVQKWIERYQTHLDSDKDLNEHDKIVLRELYIRFDWISHLYELGRLLTKQLKEIPSLSLSNFMRKDYPAEFSTLYEYYERNNRSVSFVHDQSLPNDMSHKSNIVMVIASKRFKKLKNNLNELWYNVPKSSLKLYFTEPTAWGKFLTYLIELYAWIKDSIQGERRKLDRLLYTPLF
ncbi:hypothetical protein BD770DRAFT_446750 [Pilaira anomala]|nr:hypothetical protein BD770DRAFT_446750 [Pilaira anomala]